MPELIIGLMAGTSADGVDAALVDTSLEKSPRLIASHFHSYPADIQKQIIETAHRETAEFDELFGLDNAIAEEFANASSTLLNLSGISHRDVAAIGSHGQTIRHKPDPINNYTVQLGNPAVLLARSGIDVITDFRRADMAYGGQGAPLAPLFHDHVFRKAGKNTIVLNLGGIANISILKNEEPVSGFDTGPASALMDYWISRNHDKAFDTNGSWAASGKVNKELLNEFLDDNYFRQSPPKSTGREYFGEKWLQDRLINKTIAAEDVQSTLCELTAQTICDAIKLHCQPCDQLVVCGGGAANTELLSRIGAALPEATLSSPADYGLDSDFLEAVVFAWLASQNLNRRPLNLKNITGGPRQLVPGCHYPAIATL